QMGRPGFFLSQRLGGRTQGEQTPRSDLIADRHWFETAAGLARRMSGRPSASRRFMAEALPNNSRSVPEPFPNDCRSAVEGYSNNCRRNGSDWHRFVPVTANHCQKFKRAPAPPTFVPRKRKYRYDSAFGVLTDFLTLNFFQLWQYSKKGSTGRFRAPSATRSAPAGDRSIICAAGPNRVRNRRRPSSWRSERSSPWPSLSSSR